MTDEQLEVTAANAGLLPPSATDLMTLIENGDLAQVEARVEMLGRNDFLQIARAAASLDAALQKYAVSWQGAEYWCHGGTFPEA